MKKEKMEHPLPEVAGQEGITQDLNAMALSREQAQIEQQLRADAASIVMGRIASMFIADLQAQAGEIAVLKYRMEKNK